MNFIGYPGTLGADFIDYVIADPITLPMDQQPYYDEKIVHLPDTYQPNDRLRPIDERTPTRAEVRATPMRASSFAASTTATRKESRRNSSTSGCGLLRRRPRQCVVAP